MRNRLDKPKHLNWYWASVPVMSLCLLLAVAGTAYGVDGKTGGYSRAGYVFPPDVKQNGISFAGIKIPTDRTEVAERIVDQINFLLMDRRAILMEWLDRLAVSGPMIRRVLASQDVPEDLLYLVALVSDLQPNATTRSGGVGWWALGTVKHKNNPSQSWLSTNEWDDRRDPVISTEIAAKILKDLVRGKKGDWLMAIAAFLEGPEPIETLSRQAEGFSYWAIAMPPYSDVAIPRLIALKLIDTHRDFYAVDVPPLPPLAYDYFHQLKLTKDLPLHVVAKWCGTNPRAIWELNPGVDPSAGLLPKTDKRNPSGYPLRVPKGTAEKVRSLLVQEGYLER